MDKILVTGAHGQLGREIHQLAANSKQAYFFTDVDELDITDQRAVDTFVECNKIDVIINCAAYTAVDKAEDHEAAAELINHTAVSYLAEAAAKHHATLIHISTDYVFQGDQNIPYKEEDSTNPLGVYGWTKLGGEKAIAASGCRALIFRTAWLYSEFGNNFVKTMLRLTAEKDRLNVVFDQVGTPTYAADLAKIIYDAVEAKQYIGKEGLYHFSNEGVCSWYDFAHAIAGIAGHMQCDIRPCHSDEFPSKVKRPSFSVLDKAKVKNIFGIQIPHWRDSLIRCIARLNK
ncbi:dTDP-4-dehydrorhamnose reductase [Limibacterium fermenti]|uniref:dTDP-4-dehydrorhamnose reductase n=1 Tax=Limibacterium fermenti TaxID=3229863 RepID=UPI003A5E71BB